MKVAFVTPEFLSLVRKTNLADIAESLPRAMAAQRAQVMVFLPYTQDIDAKLLPQLSRLGSLEVPLGDSHVPVTYWRGQLGDLSVVLVDHPTAFENKHPYGDENGPYLDNWWRYALFSRAVLEGFALADFTPDVIHCLDWTTGLVPVFHRLHCLGVESHPAHRAGTWFGVHNRAMQGSFEREILPKIGIPHEYFRAIEGVEQGGKVNYLKAGAEFATILGTHLPHQLVDLVAHRRSDGMDETLERRKKEVVGIQNGVDYRHWDPKTDPVLAKNFGPEDQELVGKKKCKAYAQEHYNLDVNPKVPTVFVIERFDSDNGFELLNAALTPLLERGLQLVLMGPGQPEIIDRLRMVEQTFPGSCKVIEGYNVHAAHQLLAGSDAFLMPAHDYSTHTLAAIAMRYGCAPIGYAHNGLEDTLIDMGANPKTGNGYTFPHYSAESLMKAIDRMRTDFKTAATWKGVVQRCVEADFSWDACAAEYLKAYRRVTRRIRGR
ncbi:MAG: glycogen/starch synthase [Planctomycetota bacterium]